MAITGCSCAVRCEYHEDIRDAQISMIASEACGDPKMDPNDTSDPRWTPALQEVARLRAKNIVLTEALPTEEETDAIQTCAAVTRGTSKIGTECALVTRRAVAKLLKAKADQK